VTHMRRLIIILLLAQGFLTTYVVVRDFAGFSEVPLLTIVSTILAFTFTVLHAGQNLGWSRASLFILLTILIGLTFESVGVATGLIYGPYHYTEKLGPLFLDLVPYTIPIAWAMMLYPSYIIASRIIPASRRIWAWAAGLAFIGAFVMTAWDLVMDPLMVAAGHWVWEVDGPYFGIPLQNFLGWFLTALIILLLYLLITRTNPQISQGKESNNFNRLAIISYAILGGSTVLLAFNNQLGGPALAGLFAMAPWILVAWWNNRRNDYAI